MATICYIEPDGMQRIVEVAEGLSLMEGAVKAGVRGILADCGGAAACATCHVYIDPDWYGRLTAPGEDEQAMLEYACDTRPHSRLSCQILISQAIDGLVAMMPARQLG